MQSSAEADQISSHAPPSLFASKRGIPPALVHFGVVLLFGSVTWLLYQQATGFPFFLDDLPVIVENPSLRSNLDFFSTLAGSPNRTLTNWTFAVNALNGLDPATFHGVNVAIHFVNAVILYFLLSSLVNRWGSSTGAMPFLPFFATLIWMVHPLNSQPVVYAVQRSELLATTFFFLSLLLFICANSSHGPVNWVCQLMTLFSLGLGLISKESAIAFPLVLFLFDTTFLSNSVIGFFRRHWLFAISAFAGCSLFLWKMLPVILGDSAGAAGLRMEAVTWQQYAATQPEVVLRYLALIVFPAGQSFDYGWAPQSELWKSVLAVLLLSIVIVALMGLNRFQKPSFFFVAAYLILLLPTSSVIPLADLAVEHRTYAANSMLITYLCYVLMKFAKAIKLSSIPVLLSLACISVLLGIVTDRRIQVYSDRVTLWRDVIAKSEGRTNIHLLRAWNNLSEGLAERKMWKESLIAAEATLRLAPNNSSFAGNAARAQMALGDFEGAYAVLNRCIQNDPKAGDAKLHNLLGLVCVRLRKLDEAVKWMKLAHQESPQSEGYSLNLAQLLLDTGETASALKIIDEVILKKPASCEAYLKKARFLIMSKDTEAAYSLLQDALKRFPDDAEAHYLLGLVYIDRNAPEKAVEQFKLATDRDGRDARYWMLLGRASRSIGDMNTAKKAYEHALRIDARKPEAWINIGAISVANSPDYAVICFRKALELDPTNHIARLNLAIMLKNGGKSDEAIIHLQQILKEDPENQNAARELKTLTPSVEGK